MELPSDLVIGDRLAADAHHRVLDGVEVPEGWMGLDIGPKTAERYAREIALAGSVFWNGPMGAFELDPFAAGTRMVAEAVAKASGRDRCRRRRLCCRARPVSALRAPSIISPPAAARRSGWSRGGRFRECGRSSGAGVAS